MGSDGRMKKIIPGICRDNNHLPATEAVKHESQSVFPLPPGGQEDGGRERLTIMWYVAKVSAGTTIQAEQAAHSPFSACVASVQLQHFLPCSL